MRPQVVHVHVHVDIAPSPQLDEVAADLRRALVFLNAINQKENQQMLDLSALASEVTENTDAVASASALLATLAEEVRATAGDPEAVAALAARLDENNAALSAAVTANTPSAPTPEPEPEPAPEGEGEPPADVPDAEPEATPEG